MGLKWFLRLAEKDSGEYKFFREDSASAPPPKTCPDCQNAAQIIVNGFWAVKNQLTSGKLTQMKKKLKSKLGSFPVLETLPRFTPVMLIGG